jgi:hypothetical protein|tara:strand:+ start:2120 stop:2293 length:174 start_codon:yes stop_codon:yes gene_type:complete
MPLVVVVVLVKLDKMGQLTQIVAMAEMEEFQVFLGHRLLGVAVEQVAVIKTQFQIKY